MRNALSPKSLMHIAVTPHDMAYLNRELAMTAHQLEKVPGEMGGLSHLLNSYGVREVLAPNQSERTFACYVHYIDGVNFANIIGYSVEALENRRGLYRARSHEGVHVAQYNRVAALHAAENIRSPIALRPRDRLWLTQLIERDAYAKDALASLYYADEDGPDPRRARIESIIRSASSSNQSLRALGEAFFGKARCGWSTRAGSYLRESFARLKLDRARRHKYAESAPVTYARLEIKDVLQIGAAIGSQSLADENGVLFPECAQPPSLSLVDRLRLNFEDKARGIKDDCDLPTFGEALAGLGMTRDDFLKGALAP